MENNAKQVAAFVDLHNLEIPLSKNYATHFDPWLINEELREIGRPRFTAVYADFGEVGHAMRNKFAMEGWHLVDLPSMGMHKKNSADIQIAVDAISLAYEVADVDTFVLVTGDADFVPLVKKLRQIGRTTVVIGLRSSTARALVNLCDRFIAYEEMISLPPSQTSTDASKPACYEEGGDVFGYLAEFKRAYDLCLETHGEVVAASLKPIMLRLDPSFNEKRYGVDGFGEFLKLFERAGIIRLDTPTTGRLNITWVRDGNPLGSATSAPAGAADARKPTTRDYEQWLRERLASEYTVNEYATPLMWFRRLSFHHFSPFPETRKMAYPLIVDVTAEMLPPYELAQVRQRVVQEMVRRINYDEMPEFDCLPPITERVYVVIHPLLKVRKLWNVTVAEMEHAAIKYYLQKILLEFGEDVSSELLGPLTTILTNMAPSDGDEFEDAQARVTGILDEMVAEGTLVNVAGTYRSA
ncbi:MAG: hypothetical protein Kow0069_14730 [Promethearchaeota archaeon]